MSVFWARKPQKKTWLLWCQTYWRPLRFNLGRWPKRIPQAFESKYLNKKQKGIKKRSSGLGFENFSKRIGSLANFNKINPPPPPPLPCPSHNTKQISRLTVIAGEVSLPRWSCFFTFLSPQFSRNWWF